MRFDCNRHVVNHVQSVCLCTTFDHAIAPPVRLEDVEHALSHIGRVLLISTILQMYFTRSV